MPRRRLDELEALEAEAALEQLVDSIRERVMRELGLTSMPVRNVTDAEMEEVMREYNRLQAEQRRKEEYDEDVDEVTYFGSSHNIVDEGWYRSRTRRSAELRTRTRSGISVYFPLEEAGLGAQEVTTSGALGLYLERTGGSGPRPVQLTVGAGDRERAPRLTLRTRTERRTKRAANPFKRPRRDGPLDCAEGSRKRCCRHEMEVNLTELGGFDFILYPEKFSAFYCRGHCPPSYNVATDHALLQGFVHQKRKRRSGGGRRVPRTCCVPSKLSPILIAHKTVDGSPQLTYWENVVADECKCS
ncbi:bone morphogenetic protein 8A-like [Pollicipes pollicipes]|uniref:bone morphogenetic protein 8A-like n=1 Tax=Pollicipes pollicipes TaxID=41117 RepID=UPI0018854228|nr:bone morphogenetic protein 8A-like [Pollicipes pollicipes]